MKKLTLLFFLIITSYQCNSQSIETTLYIKEELVKQRDELLKKAEEIQKRIDAIDKKLGNKSNSKSDTQYITKTVNYNSLNSSTTKKKRNKPRTTRRYIRGSRDGCYYINSNGNKTYVDRSICN